MEYHIDTDDSSESVTNKSTSYGCKAIIHKKNLSFSDINNEADVYNYGKPDANLIKKSIKLTNCKIGGDLQKIFANVNKSQRIIQLEKRLLSLETLLKIAVWYFFSFTALFLSKHVIDFNSVDLLLFTGIQLLTSSLLSALNNHLSSRSHNDKPTITHQLLFSLAFIGFMRAVVIYMGLLSIKWVALSFMETVKSSAPLFTLIISFFVLKEKNGVFVQVSIVPIMLGLLLCTAYEVSFNWLGFTAALISNFAECLQFVLSKIYLGSSLNKINPADFQLYSSVAGFLMIFAMSPYLCEVEDVFSTTIISILLMGVVGVSYYLQTQMAWYLMEFLSPVTHSICNTIKCGMAVWLSILVFGNEITLWSGLGSFMVVAGVCLYQKARSVEKENRESIENPAHNTPCNDASFKPAFHLNSLSIIDEKSSNADNQTPHATNISNDRNNILCI